MIEIIATGLIGFGAGVIAAMMGAGVLVDWAGKCEVEHG